MFRAVFYAAVCAVSVFALDSSEDAGGVSRPITMDEAVVLALGGNLELKQKNLDLSYAEKEALASWNTFLPSVSLSGGLRNSHGFLSSDATGTAVSVSGAVTLTLASGVAETLRQAKLAKSSALVSYAQAELDLMLSVKTSFYKLLYDKEGLALLEENLALAKSQEDFVYRNYQNGLASELEYLRSRYATASEEPQLLNARRLYRQSIRDFCVLLGIPEDTPLDPSGDFETTLADVRLPADTATLIEQRGDVMLASLSVETAESELRAGRYNRFGPSLSFGENISVGDLSSSDVSGDGTFSVSVSIPISNYIPGSSASLVSEKNRVVVEQAKLALENTRIAAGQEVLSLYNTLQDIRATFAISQMNEEVTGRAYELSRMGFDAGLVSQTDLELARQDYLTARYSVLSAVTDYRSSLAELAHALNVSEEVLCVENAGGN